MPIRAMKICSAPGCNTLCLKGRCAEHQLDKGKHTAQDRQRARKYATNDPRWRLIRAKQLRRQPTCEHCREIGLVEPAKVVDHIDGDSHNNEPSNLQSMCWSCHSRKTAQQDGGFGNKKGEGGFDP